MARNGADPVGAAVAAVEAQPKTEQVTMRQWPPQGPITISSSGRRALVFLEPGATPADVAELCGWMLTKLCSALTAEAAQKEHGGLVIASGPIPRA